jgi:hypothetical protein
MSALTQTPPKSSVSNSHISRPTLALRLRNTRLATTLINFVRIAEIRLVAAEALRAKVDAAVRIASLATPASTVRRRHSNRTELGGLEDADAAVVVATQGRKGCVVGC